jgi:L-asparaginase II
MQYEPMQIEVARGAITESVHSVDVVVAEVEGPVGVWGQARRPILPRSAAKYLQAIPLLRSGAAEALAVSDDELALACASHSAEPAHLEAVAAWLHRIGFGADDLECGPDLPLDEKTRHRWLGEGRSPARLVNCCSGKHAGFLTVARHYGWDPHGYVEADHRVQRLVTEALEQFCQVDLAGAEPVGEGSLGHPGRFGVDGCGIPTWHLPLENLAGGMARLVRPDGLDPSTAAAAKRLVASVASRHFWVAGTNRFETRLAAAVEEAALFKSGAEGVFVAAFADRGLGVALKVRDGADRAASVAMAAVLADLGLLVGDAAEALTTDVVTNKAGQVVGQIGRAR